VRSELGEPIHKVNNHGLRLWKLPLAQERLQQAEHTDRVSFVEISSDGQHIRSAEADHTIRVEYCNGEVVAGPFTGHTSPISFTLHSFIDRHCLGCTT
jgi:WD40 repeat protein